MKTCKIEGCKNKVWSKNLCLIHTPKKPIKKGNKQLKKSYLSKKPTERGLKLKEEKKEYTEKQWEFFLKIWTERPHYCFESGQFLGYEPLSTMFHHILPKGQNKYKKYALEEWNIVLLDPNIHSLVETNISKCPKVKEYTEKLKKIYG